MYPYGGGYPQQQGGYPQQQGGYPGQPPQPGYPSVSMPQPYGAPGGLPYSAQPQIGFADSGAPPAPGGYPAPGPGGYPGAAAGGYPAPGPPHGGYSGPPPPGARDMYGAPGGYAPPPHQPPAGQPYAPPQQPGYGAPSPAVGYAPPPAGGQYGQAPPPQQPGYGAPPPAGGQTGYGAPPAGGQYGQAPPPAAGYGAPPAGGQYGQPGYGAPPAGGQSGYGAPPAGGQYGQAPPPAAGYGAPPAGGQYGQAPAPAAGYGAPPAGGQYGQAPAPAAGYGAPPAGGQYGAPPSGASAPATSGYNHPAGAVPTAAMAGMALSATKVKTEGTVKSQQGFSAERDCEILRKAMKGFGTDEKAIIDVLANRSNEQRQQIKVMFKTMYGKDLIKDLKSELGGKLEAMVLALLDKPDEFDAKECRKAIEGLGTDEGTLIEILCSRSNREIHELKAAYKRLFKKDLEKDLSGDLSGYFRRLMISLCAAGRQEDMPLDSEKAKRHAQELYSAGVKRLGTDESKFNQILCSQSYEQLHLVLDEYQRLTGKSLEQAIASEMSGNLEEGMKSVAKCVRNRQAYFAEKLYKSMKGAGTNDRALIRLAVSRCEVDMVQIKQEFQKAYGKPLSSFIQDDTAGDYKRILLALVK